MFRWERDDAVTALRHFRWSSATLLSEVKDKVTTLVNDCFFSTFLRRGRAERKEEQRGRELMEGSRRKSERRTSRKGQEARELGHHLYFDRESKKHAKARDLHLFLRRNLSGQNFVLGSFRTSSK